MVTPNSHMSNLIPRVLKTHLLKIALYTGGRARVAAVTEYKLRQNLALQNNDCAFGWEFGKGWPLVLTGGFPRPWKKMSAGLWSLESGNSLNIHDGSSHSCWPTWELAAARLRPQTMAPTCDFPTVSVPRQPGGCSIMTLGDSTA